MEILCPYTLTPVLRLINKGFSLLANQANSLRELQQSEGIAAIPYTMLKYMMPMKTKHQFLNTVILVLMIMGILQAVLLFCDEFRYEQKIELDYHAILYSVSSLKDESVLHEEISFEATFDGSRIRNFTRDTLVIGKINLMLQPETKTIQLSSDIIQNANRSWRIINLFHPFNFDYHFDLYSLDQIYYAKDFSILVIPFYSQSKLLVLAETEINNDLFKEAPVENIVDVFGDLK